MVQALNSILLTSFMGVLAALSLVLYGLAFRGVDKEGIIQYLTLAVHPYFLLGMVLQLAVAIVFRIALFNQIGVTKTILISPLGFLITATIIGLVFREPLSVRHWIGAIVITSGVIVVSWK